MTDRSSRVLLAVIAIVSAGLFVGLAALGWRGLE